MLKITVELVPYGDERFAEKIGDIKIINRGDNPQSPEYGNYTYLVDTNDHLYDGKIEEHFRSDGWQKLLLEVLKKVVP